MLVSAVNSDPYALASSSKKLEAAQESSSLNYQQVDSQISVLTNLAQFTMSSHISDLNLSEDSTSFAYYKSDNSMAMRAESHTQVHLHEETYNFEINYSAEALGLTEKDFNGGKPMVLKFSFQQKEINYESIISARVVNTLRNPLDILTDLAKALRDVLRDGDNKSVSYVLDDEARKSLLSDPKITKLVNELILLMASINLAKKQGQSKHYTINVSGKGKPWIDYQEKTNIDGKSQTVNYTITINPPGQKTISAPAAVPSAAPAPSQPANVNVAA
jgi:hypothetical protein